MATKLLITAVILIIYIDRCDNKAWRHMQTSGFLIKQVIRDIMRGARRKADEVTMFRFMNHNNAAYEVGFIYFVIEEKYRKMIDKYNSTKKLGIKYYTFELVIYLQEIEQGYWQLDHLVSMAHEIERKYGIKTSLDTKFRELNKVQENIIMDTKPTDRPDDTPPSSTRRPKQMHMDVYLKTTKKMSDRMKEYTRVSPKSVNDGTNANNRPGDIGEGRGRWVFDYGWDPEADW